MGRAGDFAGATKKQIAGWKGEGKKAGLTGRRLYDFARSKARRNRTADRMKSRGQLRKGGKTIMMRGSKTVAQAKGQRKVMKTRDRNIMLNRKDARSGAGTPLRPVSIGTRSPKTGRYR